MLGRFLMVLSFCLVSAVAVLAQNESDERALLEVEDGISFSKDSLFLLNLRFRMQNRMALRTNSLDDWSVNSIEARVRRLRLRFDGYAGSSKLQYYIQLSFSRADTDQTDPDEEVKIVRDAILYYQLTPNFYFGFGQSKLPGNRQRVNSSGNLQFGDRSIANAQFTIDRDFGIFAYHSLPIGNMFFNTKAALSTGEGRNSSFTSKGIAYTGRAEWLPFGAFAGGGDYSEGDLEFEQTPKLSIGATYSYNNNTLNSRGQGGDELAEAVNLSSFILDAVLKYRGHALLFERFDRRSNALEVMGVSGTTVRIPAGIGINLQYSYLLNAYWELATRFSEVSLHPTNSALSQRNREWLLGATRYINKHRVKVQTNIGLYTLLQNNTSTRYPSWLFQVEFGI